MHIEHMALLVDDYDEAIRFFVESLGFDLIENLIAAVMTDEINHVTAILARLFAM